MSARVEKDTVRQIDNFSKSEGPDSTSFLKKLISQGLKEYKLDSAVRLYGRKKIFLSRTSEIVELSLYDFISLMPEKELTLNYTPKDLDQDILLMK